MLPRGVEGRAVWSGIVQPGQGRLWQKDQLILNILISNDNTYRDWVISVKLPSPRPSWPMMLQLFWHNPSFWTKRTPLYYLYSMDFQFQWKQKEPPVSGFQIQIDPLISIDYAASRLLLPAGGCLRSPAVQLGVPGEPPYSHLQPCARTRGEGCINHDGILIGIKQLWLMGYTGIYQILVGIYSGNYDGM